MDQQDCPHGWTDCSLCIYEQLCKLGLYDPEAERREAEHRKAIELAAARAKEQVQKEVMESVNKIKFGQASVETVEEVINLESEQFWARWGALSPEDPQNRQREPVNAMSGAIELGGGSKSGKKHKKPMRKVPEYMKFLKL